MISGILASSIPPRIQAIAVVSSVALMLVVINLIRKEKLKEGYSIIWFLVGLTLVLFATLTKLLDLFARAVGIAYSPAALFLILTGSLFLLALHFSVLVSKHDRRIRHLAQENALLRNQIEQLQRDSALTRTAEARRGTAVSGAARENSRAAEKVYG